MGLFAGHRDGGEAFSRALIFAGLATALLWAQLLVPLPDFLAGLAAGSIVAALLIMFFNRSRDEYTLSLWQGGTSAGFGVIMVWLVLAVFAQAPDVEIDLSAAGYIPALLAMTIFVIHIVIRRFGTGL